MWKDVIFSGLILLICIKLTQLYDYNEDLKFKNLIPINVITLLMMFMRNNGLYIYIILLIFMLIVLKRNYKVLLLSFTIIFGVYCFVVFPVFNKLQIHRSEAAEYIGIPIQQIGRMAYKNISFSQYDIHLLDDIIGGVDNLKNNYMPDYSDGIKFSEEYNNDAFNNNKLAYFKMWFKLVLKHPDIALESYAISTLGYWYPGVNYFTTKNEVEENELGIVKSPKASKPIQNYINILIKGDTPIINMIWNTSIVFWIISIFCYVCIKRKGFRYILPYIPILGIWLTLMIATPAFAEFRYVYGAYVCLPLLISLPFMNNKKQEE